MAPTILEQLSAALAGNIAANASGVVAIRAGRSALSGFVWRPGLVVTAEEALPEDSEPTVILQGGEALRATLAGRDPTTDVALLRLEREVGTPPALGTATPSTGALVQLLAASDGAARAALGTVALAGPAWRSLRGGEIDQRIELSIPFRHGAEGALVLDASGRAFGMGVSGPRRRVLVIPAATIERVAVALLEGGHVARGYLGLRLQPVALDGGGGMGAMVMGVDPGGPGAAAGIRQGDVILAWDDKPIEGVRALMRALGPSSVGTRVDLTLGRAGAQVKTELKIAGRPAA